MIIDCLLISSDVDKQIEVVTLYAKQVMLMCSVVCCYSKIFTSESESDRMFVFV